MSIVVLRDVLRAKLVDQIDGLATGLINGAVPTIETYRHITGKIAGLKAAIDLLDEETRRLLGAGAGPEQEKTHAGIYDP